MICAHVSEVEWFVGSVEEISCYRIWGCIYHWGSERTTESVHCDFHFFHTSHLRSLRNETFERVVDRLECREGILVGYLRDDCFIHRIKWLGIVLKWSLTRIWAILSFCLIHSLRIPSRGGMRDTWYHGRNRVSRVLLKYPAWPLYSLFR